MSSTYGGLAPGSLWIWRPSNAVSEEKFRTLVTEFETGAEQRRAKWDSSLIGMRFQFEKASLTIDEITDMWRFYRHKRGAYDTFLLPTYAEITRVGSNYAGGTQFILGQTMDFTTDARSHFSRFYVEAPNGNYDFFTVASVVNGTTVNVSASGVNSYQVDAVVYPVIKARFAEDLFSREDLGVLLTTIGLAFTEVRS